MKEDQEYTERLRLSCVTKNPVLTIKTNSRRRGEGSVLKPLPHKPEV